MASLLNIERVSVTGTSHLYRYSGDGHEGEICIDAETGSVTPNPETVDPSLQAPFMMTYTKLRQHWRSGTLPERTSWAS